jgi:hypothetical protein
MIKPSEIEATARAYGTQFEIIADAAHNSMLDPTWQAVAERILVWLKEMSRASQVPGRQQ